MNTLSFVSGAGFVGIAIVFYYRFYKHLLAAIARTPWPDAQKRMVGRGLLIGFFGWSILIAVFSLTGFTTNFELFPVNITPFVILPLLVTLAFLFTKSMREILEHLQLKALTQLQVFRVFVELILWLLFIQNLIPVQMTFEGYNWDVLTGITSLLAARYLLNSNGGLIAWNIFGLILLVNIVTIAILSMPTPLRVFDNEPANRIVTVFPFIYLPTLLVPLAYILHFISLRKLLMKS